MTTWLAAGVLLGSVLGASSEPPPPPTTQPSGYVTLRDAEGRDVARVGLDPRGVCALRLAAEPDVNWVSPHRDQAWHYREWQWWKGHPWGDVMRPRYWGRPALHLDRAEDGYVGLTYEADGFAGIQQFLFAPVAGMDDVHYDVVITVVECADTNPSPTSAEEAT